ncbi:MAG: class I tRNA ligase family protein, partial [Pseudomonadales bacterium]|nr:class I tRNA ligase family protein [Pseudomonadales bacterium]
YCDWYLELTKPLLWDEAADAAALRGTRYTLLRVLEALLRTTHPVMPFITESIWRASAPLLEITGPTIMLQPFPQTADFPADSEAEAAIEWLKQVIVGIRNIRGEANIKPSTEIEVLLQNGDAQDRTLALATDGLLKRMAKISRIRWLDAADTAPPNALAVAGDLKIMVPLAGLIDVAAEKARIGKEIERKRAELRRLEGKLANASFVAKAPAAVVDAERVKAADAASTLVLLETQLKGLDELA